MWCDESTPYGKEFAAFSKKEQGLLSSMSSVSAILNVPYGYLQSLLERKKSLQLDPSGSYESLHKEARGIVAYLRSSYVGVSLSHMLFEGGKADLAKGISQSFQISHSYTLGGGTGPYAMPPTYHFASIFVQGKHLLHGMFDTNGTVQGKYQYTPVDGLAARIQSQLSKQEGQSMVQMEMDWVGADNAINVKAINPDIISSDLGTGIFIASAMQSIHKNIAIGIESVTQRVPHPHKRRQILQETVGSIAARILFPTKNDVLTVQLQQSNALQATFWHKVSDRVELAADWQAVLAGPRPDSSCSIALKLDYKQACIRAQVDTQAKVGLLYEEKLFPGFSLVMSGELDHAKGTSKWGLGVNLEN
jgi:mitochondrial import receptor subunit TOM40